MTVQHAAVQRLMELGFSQYEAQAYVGLLGREPLTGYALANVTGIPQPKVYETLRRLTAKGVVRRDERVVAYVVGRGTPPPTLDDLRAFGVRAPGAGARDALGLLHLDQQLAAALVVTRAGFCQG